MEDRDARVAPVKFFHIEQRQIDQIARRYGPQKPDPEALLSPRLRLMVAGRRPRLSLRAISAPSTIGCTTPMKGIGL
jgi:hypothetical protein